MSKTIATFRSSKFNTSETKEYFINPQNYGDDAAIWIAGELEKLGSTVERGEGFPGQEDFGWYFNFNQGNDKYCLVLGSRLDDNEQIQWLVWIERNCGFIGSVLGRRKKNISGGVVESVHKALSSSGDATDIRWYEQKEFDAGNEANGSETP